MGIELLNEMSNLKWGILLGDERPLMLHEGQGPAGKRGRGTAERTWFACGLPLPAYVSSNSGVEERRDEIMGPTRSPTLVLRAAGPWGLGFLGTFGAWEPKPRKPGFWKRI